MDTYSPNTYNLHRNDRTGQVEAIKIGFSWPAFFCGPLWALFRKMWWPALGLLYLSIAAGSAYLAARILFTVFTGNAAIRGIVGILVIVGYMYLIGYCGNNWRQYSLLEQGY
jgi:Protein of unknown function (DUF2628)